MRLSRRRKNLAKKTLAWVYGGDWRSWRQVGAGRLVAFERRDGAAIPVPLRFVGAW